MARTKNTNVEQVIEEINLNNKEVENKEENKDVVKNKTYKVKVLRVQKFYLGNQWYYFEPDITYTVNESVRNRLREFQNISV